MKVRLIIVGIAATLALAGSSMALGAGTRERLAVGQPAAQAQSLPKSLMNVQRTLNKGIRVRCGNLACVNGALTAIGKAFRQMTVCMSFINVAQYDGYAFSNDGGGTYFQTTALDAAQPGDPATKVAIITC
jgi:hypothetical protein